MKLCWYQILLILLMGGVGYSFEEEVFDSSVTEISATKIRRKLREEGKLD